MSDKIKKKDLEKVTGGAPFPPGTPKFVQCPKCGQEFNYTGPGKDIYWDHVNSCQG